MKAPRLILGAIALAALVVGIGGLVGWLRPAAPPSAGATADGLPVIDVREALAAGAAGSNEERPLAVQGYYSTSPALECPAPADANGQPRAETVLERRCEAAFSALTDLQEAAVVVKLSAAADTQSMEVSAREPVGPWLPIAFLPGSRMTDLHGHLPLTPVGSPVWMPVPVVFVGHFADHRAAGCPPADQAACLAVFAVDHVAWANGQDLGPVRYVDPGGDVPPQRSAGDAAMRAAEMSGAATVAIASMADQSPNIRNLEPLASVPDGGWIWYVRLIARGEGGHPVLRTIVLADPSLEVVWRSDAP